MITVIEAGVGLRLAKQTKLLADESGLISAATSAKSAGALWDSFTGIVFSKEFGAILLFLAVCFGVNLCAKWAYRKFFYGRILRGIVSASQRSPIEVKAKAAERRDAVVVHDTTYAPAYRRVAGFVIDGSVFGVWVFVAMGIIGTVNGDLEKPGDATNFTWFAACMAFSWLYSTLQVTGKRQATLGMRAAGIFRTDLYGQRLSLARATAWYGYRIVTSLFYGLPFLAQLWTRKRQTFPDWLAKTVVLRRRSPESAPVVSPAGQVPAA